MPFRPHALLFRSLLCLSLVLLCAEAPQAHAKDPAVKAALEVLKKNARLPFEQDKREKAIRDLGTIGGKEAAAALLPLFEDPFVHLHDRAVSAWITMLKGSAAAETQTWLTGAGLSNRNPHVRASVVAALGVGSGTEIEEPLRIAINKEKKGPVLVALARAVQRLRGTPKLDGVLLKRLKHKDGEAVLALSLAAAEIDGQAAIKPLLGTLRHRAALARAGAVYALQSLDALPAKQVDSICRDKTAAPAMALAESLEFRTKSLPWPGAAQPLLERLLAHGSWRVRAAAVQGALRLWDNGIVLPLIERLGAEDGRIQDDVRRALETYTRKSLGADPELWQAWWRQNGPAFEAGERPAKDGSGDIRFRTASEGQASDGASTTVAFFNLPLRSKRFAFIFDLSGSMRNAAKKGSDEGPTKLDLLKAEMRKTLQGLPPDTEFDLYVYRYWSEYPPATKLTRALGKMKPCSKKNVKQALKWLDQQEARGWGAFYEPLEVLLADDVDSVVLLSDGRPSRGRYDRDVRILEEFPRANRFRRMAVNTILVGTKGADRKFMQQLAGATGGRFQEAAGK